MVQLSTELPTAPRGTKAPGWYSVGTNPNDQAFWDGRRWTARRRWTGAGWSGSPLEDPPGTKVRHEPLSPSRRRASDHGTRRPETHSPSGPEQFALSGHGALSGFEPDGATAAPTNRFALASLIVSLLWVGGIGSILAVIFGLVSAPGTSRTRPARNTARILRRSGSSSAPSASSSPLSRRHSFSPSAPPPRPMRP